MAAARPSGATLLLALALAGVAAAQEVEVPPPPVVPQQPRSFASRLPAAASAPTRVLTRRDIALLPGRSLLDLLLAVPGLDVKRLGWDGTLGTVSLRGAGPSGTLILVDGEPVNDPGSSLASADLDLARDAIERIEVIYGDASAVYGPGAVGGVVAITSRGASLGKANAQWEMRYAHGTDSLDAYGYRAALKVSRTLSAAVDLSRSESSGYAPNTDFAVDGVRASARVSGFTASLAYMGRSFGLGAFDPESARAFTRVRTARLGWDGDVSGWAVDASAFLRVHDSTLDVDAAGESTRSRIGTVRVSARHDLWGGAFVAGLEGGRHDFSPSAASSLDRTLGAAFLEYGRPLDGDNPATGAARLALRADWDEGFGVHVSPRAEVSYGPWSGVKLRASAGTAFRLPTLAEELAAPAAEPETSESVEAGGTFTLGRVSLDVAGFARWAHGGLAPADFTGVEATLELAPAGLLSRLAASVSYAAPGELPAPPTPLNDPVDLKWSLVAGLGFPFRLAILGRLTYRELRVAGEGRFLLDARMGWQALQGDIFEVFVEGQNLLDEDVVEGGARLPGRIVAAGLNVTW